MAGEEGYDTRRDTPDKTATEDHLPHTGRYGTNDTRQDTSEKIGETDIYGPWVRIGTIQDESDREETIPYT